jgi:hypothetical protein
MTSPRSDQTQRDVASLDRIIVDSGHAIGARVTDFARLATAVQRLRFTSGASNTDQITRSTGLWTLMQMDSSVESPRSVGS